MDEWKILLGVAGLLVPVVLAAMARDRSLMSIISSVKDDTVRSVKASTDPIHERINRFRDEYVRRDDLEGHLTRIDKQFNDLREDFRRGTDEIKALIRGGRAP